MFYKQVSFSKILVRRRRFFFFKKAAKYIEVRESKMVRERQLWSKERRIGDWDLIFNLHQRTVSIYGGSERGTAITLCEEHGRRQGK